MSKTMSRLGLALLSASAAIGFGLQGSPALAEGAVATPAAVIKANETPGLKTAVFAGGCFWGVEAVFSHIKGVTSAVSGFDGGDASTAHYERVSDGDTGHAEAVKVTYDPKIVRYDELLRVFFAVVTDPTELNRQGPDTGTQYRNALFPRGGCLPGAAQGPQSVASANRHAGGIGPSVLRGRGLPSGFRRAQSRSSLHRAVGLAQSSGAQADVPAVLESGFHPRLSICVDVPLRLLRQAWHCFTNTRITT
jgi:hypothetical protein